MPLDERTTAYILATRRPFEDVRQVASQLAGLLVLVASGAKQASPDHPLLAAARDVFDRAADEIRRARPDARTRRHHRHLLQAVGSIEDALAAAATAARADRVEDVDAMLIPLKAGYAQLQQAADLLPGFELVALGQGCCAVGQVGRVGQGGQVGQVGREGQVGQVGLAGLGER